MNNLAVLVLNQNYEPLNICRTRRALMLLYWGKAEMLENGVGLIHSANTVFQLPSVIRLVYMVKRPRPKPKLTRFEVFNRDRYTCQYCGGTGRALTLDHVIPRHQGGEHTWGNLITACIPCNRRKAGRTPQQAGMKLLRRPQPPRNGSSIYIPSEYRKLRKEWQKYLPSSS